MCVAKKFIKRKRNDFLDVSKVFAWSVKNGIKITIPTNVYYRNHYFQYAQAEMPWNFTFFIVADRLFGFHLSLTFKFFFLAITFIFFSRSLINQSVIIMIPLLFIEFNLFRSFFQCQQYRTFENKSSAW